jgi:hypothetical protein
MTRNGLHLHPRANGLVITADDGTTIKASSVSRDFSKPKLEQRFGPFQPRTGTGRLEEACTRVREKAARIAPEYGQAIRSVPGRPSAGNGDPRA